jgi:hypothetical protein
MPEYNDQIEMWKRSSSFHNLDLDGGDKAGEEEFNKLRKFYLYIGNNLLTKNFDLSIQLQAHINSEIREEVKMQFLELKTKLENLEANNAGLFLFNLEG